MKMPCIKNASDNDNDYVIQSVPFKQFVYDNVYAKEELNSKRVSFINCNIEGGEENVLEDVLHFAYNNKCKVYVTFHLFDWLSKQITDFEYLFKFFKTNCPQANICEYLTQNPCASILFEPIEDAGMLIKKNMTALIVGFNQFTFIKNMVKQLEKYTSDIIIVDNNSTYQPLLDYYQNEYKYSLLRQKKNFGHQVWNHIPMQKLCGEIFILTDPDLQFNPRLPDNFIQEFIELSNYFSAARVGFALLIDSDDIRTDTKLHGQTIQEYERQFWTRRIHYLANPHLELYNAVLDSTFCLINRRHCRHNYYEFMVRVAGDYTCVHISWHKGFHNNLEEGEYDIYLKNNISTTWYKVDQ